MKILDDGDQHTVKDVIKELSIQFELTDEERRKLTPIGKRRVFDTRVMWAVSTLRNTGCLKNIERGVFNITSRGREVLKDNPNKIDSKYLSRFQEYRDFIKKEKPNNTERLNSDDNEVSPTEIIEEKYLEIKQDLQNELLLKIKEISPYEFESLVTKLLTAMGYGFPEDGRHNNKTRDGGIDGIISQDKLGLEKIYLQAKRWNNAPVGVDEIHKFVGVLSSEHGKKGVFITTSTFTDDAIKSAKQSNVNVRLISGGELTELLYSNNLGVNESKTYTIKKIDQDFFDEN